MTDVLERTATTTCSNPHCTARLHGTVRARRAGCRSAEAETAWRAYLERNALSQAVYRRDHAKQARRKARELARRMANGHDPRTKWRGPDCRVGRWTMVLLDLGAVAVETKRERQVATWRMTGKPNRHNTGIITQAEIAELIGVTQSMVGRYVRDRAKLREQRTARRLADAQWRAYHKHGWRGPVAQSEDRQVTRR